MRNNPKAVRFSELGSILRKEGFTQRKTSGSHRVFKRGTAMISVPYQKPYVNEEYVEQILEILETEGE